MCVNVPNAPEDSNQINAAKQRNRNLALFWTSKHTAVTGQGPWFESRTEGQKEEAINWLLGR